MILSVSRRTDIPAFYSDWFYNRIKEGFVYVRNPMNIHQVSKIDIKPNVVDCIVFWTKNPAPLIKNLSIIERYDYYFQYSITGYGKTLEPNVPVIEKSIETFKYFSNLLGSKKIIWRYDPIILTDKYDLDFHIKHFEKIASQLENYTQRCVISFVDFYKKTVSNLTNINYSDFTKELMIELALQLKRICDSYNIQLVTCAEEVDLENIGVEHGKCIDDKLIEEIFNFKLELEKDKNQRKECGCVASVDIGHYNSCSHNCLYCYANFNKNIVNQNTKTHSPLSKLLIGEINENDKITERKVFSCKKIQGSLF